MGKCSKLKRLLVAMVSGTLFFAVQGAQAAQQYWISLGSYSQLPSAQQMKDQAQATFPQLSVVPSESSIGLVYRVVNGPLDSHATANERLEKARMAGFLDAWLLVKDESFVMPDALSDAELAASTTESVSGNSRYDASYRLQDSASSAVLEAYSSQEAEPITDVDDDYVNLPLGEQELVESAPAGYGLHQLRRAGASAGRGASANSRLRELDDMAKPDE